MPPDAPISEEDRLRVAANPSRFLWFRLLFNCRFYYPVYAIMFLDFGLSEEQFAYLNVAWALSIVLLEVPSGALADQLGRRNLVVLASVLMVIEMLVLALMPVVDRAGLADDPEALHRAVWILFAVFCVNRVISGAAEAAASGADEALAYDSLPEDDREGRWSRLMVKLMKWQSIGFVAVLIIGAAVYDPELVNRAAGWFGIEHRFTQGETLKFPIYLNVGMAVATLLVALRLYEPASLRPKCDLPLGQSIRHSFRRTFRAGGWILHTPAALMLLLVGLFYDSIIRLYYTVNSIWFEVIGFEPRWFGFISVAGSLTGIAAAALGGRLIERKSPSFNFALLAMFTFVGLFSLAFPIRYWSVLFLPGLWLGMRLLHFFLSNYLNRVTPSENRATVLSFRGLTMNLSYGLVTWGYGLQTALLRDRMAPDNLDTFSEAERVAFSRSVFAEAASWWWGWFLFTIFVVAIYRRLKIGKTWNELLAKPVISGDA
ncbi:MAG: MFS transporter [Verrucomicrobiae bacterium]|nr:MFS transporter [Verrucomicrobiae bacterium]